MKPTWIQKAITKETKDSLGITGFNVAAGAGRGIA